ncbi:MAG TPA: hypothetical protein VGF88_02130 [Acidobacteriaceae bacterium]
MSLSFTSFYGIVVQTMRPRTSFLDPGTLRPALRLLSAALLLAAGWPAMGQSLPAADAVPAPPAIQAAPVPDDAPATPLVPDTVQRLLDFRAAEVRFNLADLMDTLRDRRHEGWVLAAYPDPKTGRPLIGAGFSLDLPERQHIQTDALNPHSFIEPSSAELWQAAGLAPTRLDQVLDQFNHNLAAWRIIRRHHRRIGSLAPQITDDEATALLRVAAIQAVENARAYCRNFDQLSGPQQMALSQLVYQMGVNLGEFGQFLNLINNEPVAVSALDAPDADAADHWLAVQHSLIESQWARLYRARAVAVIAMLDPEYLDDPAGSEHRVAAVLHPAVAHRRRGRSAARLRIAAYRRHPAGHATARRASRSTTRRKA